MTATVMYRNTNGYRHRAMRPRAPEAAPSVVDTPSSVPASTTYSTASAHIPAIAGVISAIGVVIILVLVVWKYTSMKKTRAAPSLAGKVTVEQERHYDIKHIDLEDVSVYMEKPEKAVLTPTSFDNQVGWVPQIKSNPYGAAGKVAVPQPMATNKKSRSAHLTIDSKSEKHHDVSSPPPSYFATNGNPESQSLPVIPVPPSPPTSTSTPPTPPTPPANRKTKSSFSHLSAQIPLPTPSPRSESFAAQDIVLPRETADTYSDDSGVQRLPRLMMVATTFTPTLDDELSIKLGDTIRMVEEYRDGWCLVQRVGRIDAPKGVVPRFCLQERQGVVPTHKPSVWG